MNCYFSTIFFILVFTPALVQAQGQCFGLFSKHEVEKQVELVPFAGPRISLNAHELESAGVILTHETAFIEVPGILNRAGVYPLLILEGREVVISHRLPDWNVNVYSDRYLVSHRSLYETAKQYLGPEPQVMYSGELKVSGGLVTVMVDQSNTFHTKPELEVVEMEQRSQPDFIRSNAVVVEMNQARINWAQSVLSKYGLIYDGTRVKNFWRDNWSRMPADRKDGHARAEEAARIEVVCRASPPCMATIRIFEDVVRDIQQSVGWEAIRLQASLNDWGERHSPLLHLLDYMSREGSAFDVMAFSGGYPGALYTWSLFAASIPQFREDFKIPTGHSDVHRRLTGTD